MLVSSSKAVTGAPTGVPAGEFSGMYLLVFILLMRVFRPQHQRALVRVLGVSVAGYNVLPHRYRRIPICAS